jgi:aspartate/methionine/tyrosine aminotransferase
MPEFQPFLMERMMSKFEQDAAYNLSESGVYPVSLRELLALASNSHGLAGGRDRSSPDGRPDPLEHLLATELNYPHVNGTPELRANIAALYDGATAENVLVTVGAAEANYVTTRTLMARGQEIAIMLPNYMQIWGVARNHGYEVREFHLREGNGWALDLAELDEAVTDDTRLIAVCNPDNPTGHIFTNAEMDGIVAIAERRGAWILADEVYSGAERLVDEQTPSFFGRYDKVVATGSLSKAYGLPGLRIGWAVAPPTIIDEIWARHEYVAISATVLANELAAIALSLEVRPRLIQRARDYIRTGFPVLQQWMDSHDDTFQLTPPQAAAIAFIRYNLDINSTLLAERLLKEKSVFIVPGDHFGLDRFVRISFGLPHDYLMAALDRIQELIVELRD